jgi:nucleoid DNA-binding protein
MITKTELAREIEAETGIKFNLVKHVLDSMAEIAQAELAAGEDFTVPGIARISWAYTKPLTKGEKYTKGETYVGFGGVEQTAEADSKPRKAAVKLKAQPTANIKRLAPSKDTMGRFLTTKVGKAIAARKG